MSHANAIMRVLKDGLISIFADCLSLPQVVAIPDFRPCR
jgi:hypothetical protein